jgi:hypothetical protein
MFDSDPLVSCPNEDIGWHSLLDWDRFLIDAIGDANNFKATVPLLCWLTFELRKCPALIDLLDAIAVVRVSYANSSYPSIAWRLKDYSRRDEADERVEFQVARLLAESPVRAYLSWLATSGTNWSLEHQHLYQ